MAGAPAVARPVFPPRGRTAGTPPKLPALLLANSFEGGTAPSGSPLSYTAITAGNSGGVSGQAFDSVVATNGTVVYDNANIIHGGLGGRFQATSAGANYVAWIKSFGAQPQVWWRLYCYLGSLPAQNLWLFSALQGSQLCARVGVSSSGQVLIQNANQATVATTFSKVSAGVGQWFRLEGFLGGTTGVITANLFTTADSPTPLETIAVTGTATAGLTDRVRFGVTAASGAVAAFWLDDVAVSNTGPLGPTDLTAAPSHGQPSLAPFPPLTPRATGRILSSPGAPLANPVTGVPFPPWPGPVRARVPLPPAGRATGGNPGAVTQAPGVGPPLYPQQRPAQIHPARTRHGRVRFTTVTAPANPTTGPALQPLRRAVQARTPLPVRGRTAASKPAPPAGPTSGPAVPQLRRAVQAKIPRTYRGHRGHANAGAPVHNPTQGPVFPALARPVRSRRPLPPHGRTASSVGAPVQNPPPPFPVYAPVGFYGNTMTGPPASVTAEVLRSAPGAVAGRQRAVFTTTQYTTAYPFLPSLITEAVWLC